jgi:hypothetical protein
MSHAAISVAPLAACPAATMMRGAGLPPQTTSRVAERGRRRAHAFGILCLSSESNYVTGQSF